MLSICSAVLALEGSLRTACGQPAQRNRYGALIEMWPDSRLESLICQRPGLAADYRFRWTGEMRSDPNPQLVALADRRSRRQAAARGRATGRGVVSGPPTATRSCGKHGPTQDPCGPVVCQRCPDELVPSMLATQQGPDRHLGPEGAGALLILQGTSSIGKEPRSGLRPPSSLSGWHTHQDSSAASASLMALLSDRVLVYRRRRLQVLLRR
jgi:hypothetical protein